MSDADVLEQFIEEKMEELNKRITDAAEAHSAGQDVLLNRVPPITAVRKARKALIEQAMENRYNEVEELFIMCLLYLIDMVHWMYLKEVANVQVVPGEFVEPVSDSEEGDEES